MNGTLTLSKKATLNQFNKKELKTDENKTTLPDQAAF